VDDHPIFREGLVGLVERDAEWVVCGQADNAAQAFTAIEQLKPDLVLADIGLPGRSGVELLKDLQTIAPDLPVLVISMHDETLYAERLLRAGARGYIMKQEPPDRIVEGIRQVLNGQIYFSASISGRILSALSGRTTSKDSPLARLTDRELEVFRLLGEGRNNHAIAKQLHITHKTVDAHRGNIRQKLQLKNGTELISYAARWLEAEATAH